MPGYQAELGRFSALNTQVLGISVDSIFSHQAWGDSLGGIDYPLLSDFWPHGVVAEKYGVLTDAGHSERALFVVDTEGIIRYIDHHDIEDTPDNDVLFAELNKLP
jgi:alkyl hydroperoxide reductase subunit AhpC